MRRVRWAGWLLALAVSVAGAAEFSFPLDTRALVVAPHPDDETIATGGLIHRLRAANVPVYVVFLTYGDGWDWAVRLANGGRAPTDADYVALGRRRHDEALHAAAALSLPLDNISFLGFPDDGLQSLWDEHWKGTPVPSAHTRAQTVPYSDALVPGAPYTGEALVQSLGRVLRSVRPTHVFVPHPIDLNPDHAMAPRFLAATLRSLRGQNVLPRKVRVFHYLVHHENWPASDPLPSEMKAPSRRQVPATRWFAVPLSDADQAAKAKAVDAYPSQLAASPELLRNFLRTTEQFGRLQSKVMVDFAHMH